MSSTRRMAVFVSLFFLAGAAAPGSGEEAPAVARLAAELAAITARTAPPERTVVGVAVEARGAPALAAAVEARLVDDLRAAGFRGAFVAPTREAAAADGADAHLRLVLELAGDLAASGELAPVRINFFTGRPTGPGGLVSAAVPADREARLLARARPAPPGPGTGFEVVRWAPLAAAPLALAAGDLDGDGAAELAVLEAGAVHVLGADGTVRSTLPLAAAGGEEGPPVPTRDPTGTLAVVDGALLWSVPHLGREGSLRLRDGALAPAAPPPADPVLAAGGGGALVAPWRPGTNAFGPEFTVGNREMVASGPFLAAAASAGGAVAFALTLDDGRLVLLDSDLAPTAPPVPGVGAAVALADLDGDGLPEPVVSSPALRLPDRLRVLATAPGAEPAVRFESGDLPVLLLVGAAGDLDGDGRDEAYFAGPAAGGGAALWRLREADR